MKRSILPTAFFTAFFCFKTVSAQVPAPVDFAQDVLPILQQYCIDCHGSETAESKLRLDTLENALMGGDSGEPTVVPGKSDESHLIARVTDLNEHHRMPPDSDPLPNEAIDLLKAWVNDRSLWESAIAARDSRKVEHWSFMPVTRPAIPASNSVQPIDALVDAKLADAKLVRSNPAPRRELIRRLFLVMHGLPPTPEEVNAFIDNQSSNAWETLVEQVLSSPRYGERWATHWLDLVRFGETTGFETNRERPNAWHYRDWVIDAFNGDKPYDQFIVEQLVGDALGADAATGFLVAGSNDIVKGADAQLGLMQRQDELADIINTTGTAFLGLTTGCARCHNHKFDPISQSDYYAMQAVFAGVNHGDRALPIEPTKATRLVEIDKQIADLRQQLTRYIRPPQRAGTLIDDQEMLLSNTGGIEHIVPPQGIGKNPPGNSRGFKDDPGSEHHNANVSRGAYTWWNNAANEIVAVYRPYQSGKYRIWLSWGCGWNSHSTDANYVLDHDGDLKTNEDRISIARVNQQKFADGTGDVPGQSLWSGFYSSGIHNLTTSSAILVIGGETGTAVTTDALLLESIPDGQSDAINKTIPSIRPAVKPNENVEWFEPRPAKFIRFTIRSSSQAEPCIDELEIFSGEQNVALANLGAKATSSGDFIHPLHKLAHINDGVYGNANSWISSQVDAGWVQIELASEQPIDRIVWARDREGRFADRLPVSYFIESSIDATNWGPLASSDDRMSVDSAPHSTIVYDFDSFSGEESVKGRANLADLNNLLQLREELSRPTMIYAGTFTQPGPIHRLYRGEPGSPREQVAPNAIASLTDLKLASDSPEQERRLAIARWIASRDNPLTARVMANRIWQFHFGVGIVDTPSDLGGNGTPPSHPELLDWLASELMDSGWSIKHLQRTILLSATWQQAGQPNSAGLAVDADSRFLWRFPPRRLEAEGIRDCMLAVTGKLDLREKGPGFSTFEVEMENVRHYFPKTVFGAEDFRRMIYMTKVRQERDAVFGVFDCPDYSQVVPKRSRSTTPLQALNLLNSNFVMQQADLFIERLNHDAPSPHERVRLAYELCFSRPPNAEEVKEAIAFIDEIGWQQFARAMLNSNEFVFIP